MKRFHIDRIDLDMRGVSPAAARAAVRQLGPAIREQMARRDSTADRPGDRAASRHEGASGERGLADRAARQIVGRMKG